MPSPHSETGSHRRSPRGPSLAPEQPDRTSHRTSDHSSQAPTSHPAHGTPPPPSPDHQQWRNPTPRRPARSGPRYGGTWQETTEPSMPPKGSLEAFTSPAAELDSPH